jgi:hypothetical protein
MHRLSAALPHPGLEQMPFAMVYAKRTMQGINSEEDSAELARLAVQVFTKL